MTEPVDALLERARSLARMGEDDAAKAAFIEILAREPTHFGALTDLASLALATGHRSAARTAYRQAVQSHPGNVKGLVNLANVLLEDGETEEAKRLYEEALAHDPALAPAHQGLARAFDILGDNEQAGKHRDLGFTNNNVVVRPYRGSGKPLRVLLLVSALGGNVPTNILLDDRVFEITALYADYHAAGSPLPDHDLIFNAIGDADLCASALEDATKLVKRSKAPVINAPERVKKTGRIGNANLLSALDGVIVPRASALPASLIRGKTGAEIVLQHGHRFPLLLRSPGFHTGQHFVRVEDASGLREAAKQLPGEILFVFDYADARGRDGLWRKYRVLFVGGAFYPLHLALSTSWKVHYFTSAMAEDAGYRDEEARFLNDMTSVLGADALRALERVRDALGLDYGGADFALAPDGRPVLFEANATMAIVPPSPDPRWDYRRQAIANALAAARRMLHERAGLRMS